MASPRISSSIYNASAGTHVYAALAHDDLLVDESCVTTGSGKEYPKLGTEDLPLYVATCYIPSPLIHGVPDI